MDSLHAGDSCFKGVVTTAVACSWWCKCSMKRETVRAGPHCEHTRSRALIFKARSRQCFSRTANKLPEPPLRLRPRPVVSCLCTVPPLQGLLSVVYTNIMCCGVGNPLL